MINLAFRIVNYVFSRKRTLSIVRVSLSSLTCSLYYVSRILNFIEIMVLFQKTYTEPTGN